MGVADISVSENQIRLINTCVSAGKTAVYSVRHGFLCKYSVQLLTRIRSKLIQHMVLLYDFLVTVKAAPHESVMRTGQP